MLYHASGARGRVPRRVHRRYPYTYDSLPLAVVIIAVTRYSGLLCVRLIDDGFHSIIRECSAYQRLFSVIPRDASEEISAHEIELMPTCTASEILMPVGFPAVCQLPLDDTLDCHSSQVPFASIMKYASCSSNDNHSKDTLT